MNKQLFSTPILFLIFNRPDTTERVFQRIREIKPKQLFVSADGPRTTKQGEETRCIETRRIIEQIDWPCKVKTNYSDKNLGCKVGVSSGITWFFSHVEEGIILEDDCLPDLSFFLFCETLLNHYRTDDRIMQIGGVTHFDGWSHDSSSYYFSRLTQIWGWATWRRAWNMYDRSLTTLPVLFSQHMLASLFPEYAMQKFWKKKFELAYANGIDTWDIQWQYALSTNHGLALLPYQNLVSNIGFDRGATHTIDPFHKLANRSTYTIDKIIHPIFVVPHAQLDKIVFQTFINPNKIRKLWQLLRRYFSSYSRRDRKIK